MARMNEAGEEGAKARAEAMAVAARLPAGSAGETPALKQLQVRWQVQERPFISTIPLIGSLVARFRTIWNNVSTTWYVRPLLQQQNQVNYLLLQHLQELASIQDEIDSRLIEEDQQATALRRQVAELSYAMVRLEKRLAGLEERLDRFAASDGQ